MVSLTSEVSSWTGPRDPGVPEQGVGEESSSCQPVKVTARHTQAVSHFWADPVPGIKGLLYQAQYSSPFPASPVSVPAPSAEQVSANKEGWGGKQS